MVNTAKTYRFQVCFVILTRNRRERCLNCVNQAARALEGLSGKILVINNSAQQITTPEIAGTIPCKVIDMGKNMGVAARNIALTESESEFLIMLDDDVLLEFVSPEGGADTRKTDNGRKLVGEILRIFQSDPKIGAVALTVYHNGSTESCLLPTVFHGCACAFRTSALEKIGGYPSDFLYYGEEYSIAFRLYQSGYRIVMPLKTGVYHDREGKNRNQGRIIRLLMRNNAFLWVSSFPWHALPGALKDTIRRYFFVARKEKASLGFWRGFFSLPWAILRGILQRNPLSDDIFQKIALIGPVEAICGKISSQKVIICGTGKFPSLWLKIFRKYGIEVKAFWDTNICWKGRKICGVPVITEPDEWDDHGQDALFAVGLSSISETCHWKKHLQGIGLQPLSSIGKKRPEGEKNSKTGTFDLLSDTTPELYCAPRLNR